MITIIRTRYIIVRDGTEVLCGKGKDCTFKSPGRLDSIKTFWSRKQATAALNRMWFDGFDVERYRVCEIKDVIL
jgi:hypothetical protein